MKFQRGRVLTSANLSKVPLLGVYHVLNFAPREIIHHRKEASAIVSEFKTSKSSCGIKHTVILSFTHFSKVYPVPMYCLPRTRMNAGELRQTQPLPSHSFQSKELDKHHKYLLDKNHNQGIPFLFHFFWVKMNYPLKLERED